MFSICPIRQIIKAYFFHTIASSVPNQFRYTEFDALLEIL